MGGKGSKEKAQKIDLQLEEEQLKELLKFKILCLGAGESGKSTVVKQLKNIYLGNIAQDSRQFISVLNENTIQCMQSLIRACSRLGLQIEGEQAQQAANRIVNEVKLEENPEEFRMTPDIANDVVMLWNNDTVKKCFERRNEFWMLDGAEYYFERAKEFAKEDFTPTDEDLIMARARTTGIITTEFDADNLHWQVVDVGGQRSERKKWINCFDDVRAVIFVVNLSGYNSVLFEDEKRNRMTEALELFEQIAQEKTFLDKPIFIFFNKKDLFEARLQKASIRVCFPNYTGPDETKSCLDYITQQFMSRVPAKRTGPTVLYWHIAARYKKDIQYAFAEIREQLVNHNKAGIKKAMDGLQKIEQQKKSREGKDKKKKDKA